jgi:hypothetical protein
MTVSETALRLATDAVRETRLRIDNSYDAPDPTERAYDEFLARAALTAALSDQPNGWQDISTAPKDGSWFLAADSHTPFAYRARWGNFDDFVSEGQMVSMELYGSWTGWPPEVWCFMPDPPHMRLAVPPPSSTAGEVG